MKLTQLTDLTGSWAKNPASADDPHDVAFLHDQQVLAVELDLGAGPLAEQHAVAGLDVERRNLAVFGLGARTDGDDLALARLFLGAVGDDDAAGGLFLGLNAADQNAVVQRTECHCDDLFHVQLMKRIGTPYPRVPAGRIWVAPRCPSTAVKQQKWV